MAGKTKPEPEPDVSRRDAQKLAWDRFMATRNLDRGAAFRAGFEAGESSREAAEAEIERLRGALRRIAEARRENPAPGYEDMPLIGAEMRRIARAALSPREDSEQ